MESNPTLNLKINSTRSSCTVLITVKFRQPQLPVFYCKKTVSCLQCMFLWVLSTDTQRVLYICGQLKWHTCVVEPEGAHL